MRRAVSLLFLLFIVRQAPAWKMAPQLRNPSSSSLPLSLPATPRALWRGRSEAGARSLDLNRQMSAAELPFPGRAGAGGRRQSRGGLRMISDFDPAKLSPDAMSRFEFLKQSAGTVSRPHHHGLGCQGECKSVWVQGMRNEGLSIE